jgi:hypothetical protein
MFVVSTVDASAAEENVIWMVALKATWLVPFAGVIEATENEAGVAGCVGCVGAGVET